MPKPSPMPNRPIFETAPVAEHRPSMTIGLLLAGMWKARKLGVLIIGAFVIAAILYVIFLRHPDYVATAVVEPPISSGPQLSGATQVLASFAGIESASSGAQFTKYLQVVGSTRFAARMDRDDGVMKILVSGWDEGTHTWTPPSGFVADAKAKLKAMLGMRPWAPPTTSSLATTLQHMTTIALVPGRSPLDLRSQVFSIAVTAPSRDLALNLLSWTLKSADDLVREDQLARTTNRIAYLTQQMGSTQEVYLRQSLQQILMVQEETLMTLRADKYYAIDVIDLPNVSDIPTGSSSTTILAIYALLGFAVYAGIVFVLLILRTRRTRPGFADPLREPFPDPLAATARYVRSGFGLVRTAPP
jgi:hypothetical protein